MNSNDNEEAVVECEETLDALEFEVEGEYLFLNVTCDGTRTHRGFTPSRLVSWEFSDLIHPLTKKLFVESDAPIKFKLAQIITTAIKAQLSIS